MLGLRLLCLPFCTNNFPVPSIKPCYLLLLQRTTQNSYLCTNYHLSPVTLIISETFSILLLFLYRCKKKTNPVYIVLQTVHFLKIRDYDLFYNRLHSNQVSALCSVIFLQIICVIISKIIIIFYLSQVLQGVHNNSKARQKILKEPLPDDSEEVATEDHNYSLKRPLTVAEKLAEVQQMLPLSKKRLVPVKNYRMIKKREGLQLIDALVEERLLTEETECLLRAQFSGMLPNDL